MAYGYDDDQDLMQPRLFGSLLGNTPGRSAALAAMLRQQQPPQQPQQPGALPSSLAQPDNGFAVRAADLARQREEAQARLDTALKPIDTEAVEAAGRKRAEGGASQLVQALLAQNAGEDFKPMAQYHLREAAAAREPLKMTGGTLTESGYVADPGYAQGLAVKQAEARVGAIDKALEANIGREERARLETQREHAAREARQLMISSQQSIAQQAHLDRQAALAARTGGPGKILPAKTVSDLTEGQQRASGIARLSQEFDPGYAGLAGAASAYAGRIPGVDTAAGEWWRNYSKESELVERHGLFGAALTPHELASWRAADITPTMAPEAIQRNLMRRAQIMQDKYTGQVRNYGASGYNVEAFPLPAPADSPPAAPAGGGGGGGGTGPVRVRNAAEAAALPSGTVFIDHTGKRRVRQ